MIKKIYPKDNVGPSVPGQEVSPGVSSDQDLETGGDSLEVQHPPSPAAEMSSSGPVSQTQHPAQGCPPAGVPRSARQ